MAAQPIWKSPATDGCALMYEPGDLIDIWVVERSLGRGGMGTVYRCHNRAAKRILAAVKVLDGSLKRYPEAEARFVREADILAQIDHPNIVKVRNVRPDADPPYIEMEFAAGESLDERLQHGPVPYSTAVSMMNQCSDALAYLHRLGIFHRDIKPANILVDQNRVKMVDFGLAVEADSSRITQQGVAFGTVSYAPPEWISPERLDPARWDVYALGVVFWELLTGQVAFPVSGQGNARQQAMQVIVAKQGHEPLDPGDAYHDDVRSLIADMTRADPAEREASAEAIAARVRQLEPTLSIEGMRRSVGATIAPPLGDDNPFTLTAPPSAISRVDTPYPPSRPARARTPNALPTTPVTAASTPVPTGRYLLAVGAAGTALVGAVSAAAVALLGVWWVMGPQWGTPAVPAPARLAIDAPAHLGAEAIDVAIEGGTVSAEPDGMRLVTGLAEGPAEVVWAAGEGCTVAQCATDACEPWCVTGRTTLDIVPGTVHTLTVAVEARPVGVGLTGIDGDVQVAATLSGLAAGSAGGVDATRTAEGVQFLVPPGKYALRVAAGACADGAPVGQSPGCTVLEDALVVPADGPPDPARVEVVLVTPEPVPDAPKPAPTGGSSPSQGKSSATGFVTNGQLAKFLTSDEDGRQWLPGGNYVKSVTGGYLSGWSADGTPPAGRENDKPRVVPGLPLAYCKWRGGQLLGVDDAPLVGTYEYRRSGLSVVMLYEEGTQESSPTSPTTAGFRCTK